MNNKSSCMIIIRYIARNLALINEKFISTMQPLDGCDSTVRAPVGVFQLFCLRFG